VFISLMQAGNAQVAFTSAGQVVNIEQAALQGVSQQVRVILRRVLTHLLHSVSGKIAGLLVFCLKSRS